MRVPQAAAGLFALALVAVSASAASHDAARQNGRILFASGSSYAGGAPPQAVTLDLAKQRRRAIKGLDNVGGLAISPNGRYVAFVRRPWTKSHTVWVADADGTDARKLGRGCAPTWSPRNDRIAFVTGGGVGGWGCYGVGDGIAIANRDGSRNHQVYRGYPGSPEWSSDGQWIAFASFRPSFQDLVAIRPDGSGAHVIEENVDGLNGLDWSPDSSRLAFLKVGPSQDGGSHPQVYTVPISGGEPTQLTHDSPVYRTDLRWSPDGSRIAYAAALPDVGPKQVFVLGSTDGGPGPRLVGEGDRPRWAPHGGLSYLTSAGILLTKARRSLLVRRSFGANFDEFVWFPSGKQLLFSREVWDGGSELFQLAGAAVRRRLPHIAATEPSWSPDGASLAFSKVGPAGNYQLAILRRGAKAPRVLTSNRYGSDSQPAWSPDGARIAFVRARSEALWSKRALFVRRLAGHTAKRISNAPTPDHPAWAPSGRQIAIDGLSAYGDDEHRGLRLVDVATGAVTDLTHPQYGRDGFAAWSPDGRQLAFLRSSGGQDREIRVLTLANGEERGMPYWPNWVAPHDLTWSPDGTRIAAAGFGGGGLGAPPAIWTFKPDGSDRRFLRYGYSFHFAPTAITWQPR